MQEQNIQNNGDEWVIQTAAKVEGGWKEAEENARWQPVLSALIPGLLVAAAAKMPGLSGSDLFSIKAACAIHVHDKSTAIRSCQLSSLMPPTLSARHRPVPKLTLTFPSSTPVTQ